MNRMKITLDPAWTKRAPGGFPCTINLKTREGTETVVEIPFAAGHAHNKMNRHQVIDKFRSCVESRISPTRVDEIIAAVNELEEMVSIRQLMQLLT